MRLYYIFSIKDNIYNITKKQPEKLYKVLESIYRLDKKEVKIGYKLFEKTCNFLDKKNINTLLKNLNYNNLNYTCFRQTHIFNDFYTEETTKLTVNNSHMFMKTNMPYPKFFYEIQNLKNLFVCDFLNEDYYFLNKIKNRSYNK